MLQHYHTLGQYEIGIDESGRGPMFGRVYAACCVLHIYHVFTIKR